MNANTIYDVFVTTEQSQAPDLIVGVALLQTQQDIPHEQAKEIREFMGRHYQDLVQAYQAKDREIFATAVAACQAKDEEQAQQVAL